MPKELYKYTTVEAAIKTLTTSTLRFTSPDCFNDPYDSNPPFKLKKLTNKEKELLINKGYTFKNNEQDPFILESNLSVKQLIKISLNDYKPYLRLYCFSEINNSILMWSHYADSHKGIVIALNLPFSNILLPPEKVVYNNIAIFDLTELIKKMTNPNSIKKGNNHALFLYKSPNWEYEHEYRSFLYTEELLQCISKYKNTSKQWQNCYKELKNNDKYIHLPISPNVIKAVYLGCKISQADEIAIIEILKIKYPDAKCYKAEKLEDSFNLRFNEINIL